jgi:hypothetical protein
VTPGTHLSTRISAVIDIAHWQAPKCALIGTSARRGKRITVTPCSEPLRGF